MRDLTLLAIDTTMGPCSVACISGEKVLFHSILEENNVQARLLVPLIESSIHENGLTFPSIDAISASIGPGSFTGIRIGLATARGLAFARGLPIIGISTLQAMAAQTAAASSSPQVVSVMNAGKGMYYLQIFDSKTLSPTCEAQMLPLQDICAQLNGIHAALTGNAAAEALANTPQASTLSAQHAVAYPHALYIAQLAMHQHMAGGIATSQPLYIRQPDAKLPNSI